MVDRDAQLMRSLHDEHAPALWAFVLRLTGGDSDRAQDVVQETFLRAWRSPAAFDRPDSSARSWLFTVARNIVVDQWRAGRRRPEDIRSEVPEVPEPDSTDSVKLWS